MKNKLKSLALATLMLIVVVLSSMPQEAEAQQNRWVRIYNDSSRTITMFHASNVNRGSWEEDILGSSVLGSGESIRININDGTGACRFDLKATFSGGGTVTRMNVNVCGVTGWRVYDDRNVLIYP